MSLVLSGKQKPLQAGVLANVGGERLPGGRGMHAAPVCKVNPPVGQTFHFLASHASGPTLATGRTQPTVIQGERPDQARSTQWLNAPSMLFGHVDLARESNRAGSRQYEHRREN